MGTDKIDKFVKKESCIQDILDKVNNIIVRESWQMEYDYPYFHTMVDTELERVYKASFIRQYFIDMADTLGDNDENYTLEEVASYLDGMEQRLRDCLLEHTLMENCTAIVYQITSVWKKECYQQIRRYIIGLQKMIASNLES